MKNLRSLFLVLLCLLSLVTILQAQDNDNFYIADNGVTIVYTGNTPGETAVINGETYTAVDEAMLREMVKNDEDVTHVVTSLVMDMNALFFSIDFNQNISGWDVSNVIDMSWMFTFAKHFNQNIGIWNVSKVTDMSEMFYGAEAFNQNIGLWDVSNVTDMSSMFFRAASFNQDIGKWDVSKVTDMSKMFYEAEVFNQNISNWTVSNVLDFNSMFYQAQMFNQDIGGWDVSKVENFDAMFSNAKSFNQDLSGWCTISFKLSDWKNKPDNFAGSSALLPSNYPIWGKCGTSTTIEDETNLPSQTTLSQNYPNPFNPSTQINYTLMAASAVQINVYDITGKEVATLVNKQQAAGTYSINFDAANLPSGMYIYRLVADGKTLTRKMMLVK